MRSIRDMLSSSDVPQSVIKGVAVVGGCIALATLVRAAIDPIVTGVPFITFFPAVVLAAYLAGPIAGVVTMAIGGVIAAFFWIPPFHSLALTADAWFTVSIYAFLCALLVFLIHRLRVTARRARVAEKTAQLYAREMAHRTANLVTLVQAVASMTFRNEGSNEDPRQVFDARLTALGRALTAPLSEDGGQDVLTMIRSVLAPFGDRIYVAGQSVAVAPEVSARLSLVFHELGTNALKYGALSVSSGSVSVVSSLKDDALALDWWESGGPVVESQPKRRGFGSRLLQRALSSDAGSIEIVFDAAGAKAHITIKKCKPVGRDATTATMKPTAGRPGLPGQAFQSNS